MEPSPFRRIKVEEALTHPWITEKVKLKALKERRQLYSDVSFEQKERFEEMFKMIKS